MVIDVLKSENWLSIYYEYDSFKVNLIQGFPKYGPWQILEKKNNTHNYYINPFTTGYFTFSEA